MYIYIWKLIVSFQGIVYSFSFQFYSVKLVLFHTEFMCNFPTHSPIQFHWFFFQAHSVHSPHALVCSVVTPKSFRWSRFSVVPRSAVHTSILVHDTRRRHLLQQESHTYTHTHYTSSSSVARISISHTLLTPALFQLLVSAR